MPNSRGEQGTGHISKVETLWPLLEQAHGGGSPEEIRAAQEAILERYRPAIYRYLLACLGDANKADQLISDFYLKFLRGDFRNANPEKGRFRDLLKSALCHLIADYHNQEKRKPRQFAEDGPEPVAPFDSTLESDRQFLESWRADLLNKTWERLAEEERKTGKPLHTVLHFKADHTDLRSAEMAEKLSQRLGKDITADWVRKWLSRGRDRFAELLLQEVEASIRNPTPELVEQELIDLDLFRFCKSALEKYRSKSSH